MGGRYVLEVSNSKFRKLERALKEVTRDEF